MSKTFDPEAPTVADLENAKDLSSYAITQEQLHKAFERGKKPYYDSSNRYVDWLNAEWARITGSRYRANVLGHFEYTPADELRDRLNDSLQGKQPAPAVNTRFWRNL